MKGTTATMPPSSSSRKPQPYRVPPMPHWLAMVSTGPLPEGLANDPNFAPIPDGHFCVVFHGRGLERKQIIERDLLEVRRTRRVRPGALAVVELWDERSDLPTVRCAGYVEREGDRVRLRFAETGVRSRVFPARCVVVMGVVVHLYRVVSPTTQAEAVALAVAVGGATTGGDHA